MHIQPKKRLGQNFLVDKNMQRKIIESCGFTSADFILEIGAGTGELTKLAAKKVKKIYALEIDFSLCNSLESSLAGSSNNIEVICQDILKLDLKKRFIRLKKRLKIIGNIPYYISSPIVEHLFKFREQIDTVFITVQRELAMRMTARPGSKEYGSFSCFVQYYTEPKIILNIKKTCFFPRPKVDSCFLKMAIRRQPLLAKKEERLLFKIIRAAFNQRRKTLKNSLAGIILPQKLEVYFNKFGIDNRKRPEDLSLEDFKNLVYINFS